jgi:hypothetical protein
MENWTEILGSIDTSIRLVGLCILALFALSLMFLRKAEGMHRTAIFGLLIVVLIGFASLLVLRPMSPPIVSPTSPITGATTGTTAPIATLPTETDTPSVNPDRIACAIVTSLTTGDPFLNVRVNPNNSSTLKDRLRNNQRLDVFAKNGNWYNVSYTKSGDQHDGWVHRKWVTQRDC